MRRGRMSRRHSKKNFRRAVGRVHRVNRINPMRGGIRL